MALVQIAEFGQKRGEPYGLSRIRDTCVGMLRATSTGMSDSIICSRAFEFGCRILNLAERLWNRGPAARHIATELMGCGTSIGANAEEAQDEQTKPDFIAKLSVSRKEARETGYWLRVA